MIAAVVAAFCVGARMQAGANPEALQSATAGGEPVTVVVKPDELRNARPRKKPRMVLRCALFGRYIEGCNPT
jgi:hypothetical protein